MRARAGYWAARRLWPALAFVPLGFALWRFDLHGTAGLILFLTVSLAVTFAVIALGTTHTTRRRRRRRARRIFTEGAAMRELTSHEIQRGQTALSRLEAAWPRFCREIGLTRVTEKIGAHLASRGASVFAPRNRVGQIVRLGAHVGAAMSGQNEEIPSLLRVWACPLGPVIAIPAGWISAADLEARTPRLAEHLGVLIRVEADSAGSELRLTLVVADPLSDARVLNAVPVCDDPHQVPFGYTENGEEVALDLWDQGGMVAAGIQGSGKSVGAILNPFGRLAAGSTTEFAVVDGKGGEDLGAFEHRAFQFVRYETEDDLQAVNDLLVHVQDILRWRRSNLREHRDGHTSFWSCNRPGEHPGCDGGGPTREWPLVVVLLDEFPVFMVKSEVGATDKELLRIAEDNQRIVRNLIRLGRSSGVFVVLATQKSTADAIPTAIRDLCSIRIGFRVMTRQASEAVLGDGLPEDAFQPHQIGAGQPGVCAMRIGDSVVRARADYIPEYVVRQRLSAIDSRDPMTLARDLEAERVCTAAARLPDVEGDRDEDEGKY